MSLTTRVLLGLVAGLTAGILISLTGSPQLLALADWVEPVGRLWVNAIQMTVIPLVVSLLIVGVAATGDAAVVGRLGGRAAVLFLVAIAIVAFLAIAISAPLFEALAVDPDVSVGLRAAAAAGAEDAAAGASRLPTFAEWLTGLIPTNPVRAATEGAMLPLIVFSLAFGLALTRIALELRESVVAFFRGVADAMLILVNWVLALAPIGVFALALPLATRMGLAAAGALAYYVFVVVLLCFLVMGLLYPVARVWGGVPLRRFGQAAFPGQAVALSARSSVAALPLLIEEAERTLRFPTPVVSFFLPLSASIFRPGSAIGLPVGVLFIARLYGVDLGVPELLGIGMTSVLLTFSVPSIPGGSIFIMAPVMLAAGVPLEGIGILLGVDTIPDMFRTTTNVTGHMAIGSILSRPEAALPLAAE